MVPTRGGSVLLALACSAWLLGSDGGRPAAGAVPVDSDRAQAPRALAISPPADALLATDDDRVRPPLAASQGTAQGADLDDPRDGIRRPGEGFSARGESPATATERAWVARAAGTAQARKSGPIPQVGGDDVVLRTDPDLATQRLAIASNGHIYVAIGYSTFDPSYDEWIEVYRSTNGGDTFTLWGTLNSAPPAYDRLWGLHIAEGTVDRIYVLYQQSPAGGGGFDMRVAFEDLGAASATWTDRAIFDVAGVSFLNPDLDSDAVNFAGFYMYAVSTGLDGDGDDVWFTRSTDYGDTWSAPYRVSTLSTSGNLMYSWPRISYGFGGVLHLHYTYTERLQDTFDDAVRYRRALNYGAAPTDWQPTVWALTSTSNVVDEWSVEVEASPVTNMVVLAISKGWSFYDPDAWYSDDAGASWSVAEKADLPFTDQADIIYRRSTAEFIYTGAYHDGTDEFQAICRAPEASPLAFTGLVGLGDATHGFRPELAMDPTRGDRVAATWGIHSGAAWFDAEWRGDPGYPNLEAGFPLAVASRPVTPPAVVNLDADPYLEIVWGDVAGNVHLYSHTGVEAGGWPRNVGGLPTNGPIAVGDLDGNGTREIVAGSTSGWVHAFTPTGAVVPGFPVDLGTNALTYVSIGALGPPYPRWIVACSGDKIFTLNYRGEPGPYEYDLSGPLVGPAAIGDVDDDGVTEFVTLMGPAAVSGWSYLHVWTLNSPGQEAFRSFPTNQVRGAPTLADLDLNGDLEIAVPTAEGKLFVVHHNGADMAGFPFDTGLGVPLTSVAMAQFLGTSEPDLAFASRDWQLHVVTSTGVQQSAYPEPTGTGWYLFGAPILDNVHWTSSNLIVGSRDGSGWTYRNIGGTIPGWPKSLGGQCELTPASGDLDQDGRNEIVFLTLDGMAIVDVGYPAGSDPQRRWPMYGYDPQRTGCLNCLEDVRTDVAVATGPTRVAFAAPYPNPASASVVFRYTLPAGSAVTLDVYDVRGRRVRGIVKREEAPGEYLVTFDGRDRNGAALAAGQYFARLRVDGPGVSETLTRRFSVVR